MKLTENLLKNAITAKYEIHAYRDAEKIHVKNFVTAREDLKATESDLIRSIINKDGRFDEYMNYLQYELAYYPFKYQETVVFPLDVGSIIALEYLIKDEDGDPYECEPTQFYFLLDPAIDSVKTAARRLSKSFSDRIPAYRNCISYSNFGIQVTRQSTTVAKMWLDDVYMWTYNSKLAQEWAGGMPLLRDADKYIKFKNRSFILVHTASSLELISGIGVNMKIDDEKSLYTADTARGRIVARGQKKKEGKKRVTFRTSSSPFGKGSQFHKDQINTDKWQYFAPMFCPMGYNKPVCYDCEYFTQTKFRKGEVPSIASLECTASLPILDDGYPDFSKCYKRIPDDRFEIKEFKEDWRDLGKTLWLQEFMCVTQDYTGTAINIDLIHEVIDEQLEQQHKSDMTCYVGLDFGLSEKHRSAIDIVGEDENGILYNLNTIILPAGTPYRTRDSESADHRKGVIETTLGLFTKYPNIACIVADATGVGKEYVENDLTDLCRKHHNFSNVVPFKISPESKAPLWFGTVKPAMENGKIKSYMDRNLYLQMRAWRCDFDPAKQHKPRLTPPRAGEVQSDDALIAFFLAIWGALTQRSAMARESSVIGSIKSEDAYGTTVFERAGYG